MWYTQVCKTTKLGRMAQRARWWRRCRCWQGRLLHMYTKHAHIALHQAWPHGAEGALVAALRVLAKALETAPWDARLWAVYLPLYALRAGSPGAQLQMEGPPWLDAFLG